VTWWSDRVVPHLTDVALRSDEIAELRDETCRELRGRVLEIGFGSGLNVRFYPAAVTSVAAVEPSDVGWKLSEERRARTGVPIHRSGLDGQHLAEGDDSFDSALVTFSLCSIPDPALALSEVRRVLRPGASLHFLEHGLAPEAGVARWQRRLDPVQKRVFGGCHLSRDIPGLVGSADLEVTEVRAEYQPGPRVAHPWTYGYLGRAVRAGDA
jgi:ubiquinone/menaquinone biosynthesis C-methylase UbiE